MSEQPLVSIIIPTYNRAHLIGETLDSILAQTYTNWECLIVDDGSTDGSEKMIHTFAAKDPRFRYYQRPVNRPKGANACRNIGLENTLGEYVVFFDSDDLMTHDHLQTKINTIIKNQCDYVITKTQFLNYEFGNELLEINYKFNSQDVNAYNYITQKINWLTLDICIKSKFAKSILFNELLHAGQEYNYFSKLTILSENAIFNKKIVSLRRQHDHSIRSKLKQDKIANYKSHLNTYWHTYLDTKNAVNKKIRQILIYKCYRQSLKLQVSEILYSKQLYIAIIKEFGMKGIYYILKLNFR